jgi:AraC-like DNA-binding protein
MNYQAHRDAAASDYREFPVPAGLTKHFLCLWTQVIVGSGHYSHRVLPDGRVDIVSINVEPPIVVGPWTSPFISRFAAGSRITGARLRPGYALSVLGIPASELLNTSMPLTVLWHRSRTEPFGRVSDEKCPSASRFILSEVLSGVLSSPATPDESVIASLGWLARHPHGSIRQLSRWSGISERQMQRRFSAALGYGPKMFQSVLRLQRFLHLSENTSDSHTFADIAASVGYSDQPHMTREVRRFTGSPPTGLPNTAKCTLRFSDLLLGNQPP